MSVGEVKDSWKKIVRNYSKADDGKAWIQILNTLVPYFAIWILAYLCVDISIWLTLALSCINVIFSARLFIIMHDCGHGSFFKSKRARTLIGYVCGIINFTPYEQWRNNHSIHHTNSGNLDKRGTGDVWTLTVEEYKNGTPSQRFIYKTFRFPPILFFLGPIYLFQIRYRFFDKNDRKKERFSVVLTNVILSVAILTLGMTLGWKNFLLVQLPATILTQALGCWLFYVQHQFEDTYWQKGDKWNYAEAALNGSSYLKMNKFLHWCTGNIGYHHIHHLSHLIPNYNLPKCFEENEIFQKPNCIKLSNGMKSMFLQLWDESQQKLISFSEYRRRYR